MPLTLATQAVVANAAGFPAIRELRMFRITGSTPAGTNKNTYSMVEVTYDGSGYGGWINNGITVPAAYNFWENMNAAAGVQGNGVDVAKSVPAPVAAGTPVIGFKVADDWWFFSVYAGTCVPQQ